MPTLIGVDVGGTLLRAACFDTDLNLLDRAEQTSLAQEGTDVVVNRLVETIQQVFPDSPDDLMGIGVALPGPIDSEAGVLIAPPNLPFKNLPIVKILHDALGKPVIIGNDADLAGLGEAASGAGQGVSRMIYVTISTGIGGGIILDGQPFIGRGQAGEIGHMMIVPDGPLCNCGRRGHLEAVASGTAIARIARERLEAGENSLLREHAGAITAKEVGEAAHAGDPLALEIVTQAGRYLGMGIATLMMILNPDLFVLGGGVTKIGAPLFDPMHVAIKETVMHPRYYENTPLVMAKMGDDVGLYGAAALAKTLIDS